MQSEGIAQKSAGYNTTMVLEIQEINQHKNSLNIEIFLAGNCRSIHFATFKRKYCFFRGQNLNTVTHSLPLLLSALCAVFSLSFSSFLRTVPRFGSDAKHFQTCLKVSKKQVMP